MIAISPYRSYGIPYPASGSHEAAQETHRGRSPLDAINAASRREKSIRHGHPSTLHLWWARRPLAAARAVIFAQMVDDPSADPERFPTKEDQERERERLFRLLEQLVLWENTTNKDLLGGSQGGDRSELAHRTQRVFVVECLGNRPHGHDVPRLREGGPAPRRENPSSLRALVMTPSTGTC